MKKYNKTLLTTAIAVAISAALSGNSYANAPVQVESSVETANQITSSAMVERNATGVRSLDLTNPEHFALAESRLRLAGKTADKFPQLHRSLAELRGQQLAKKVALKNQGYEQSSQAPVDPADVDVIENAHLFLDMNLAVAEDNGEPYLLIRAKSSVFGGTTATYVDLLLEDKPNGTAGAQQIAPVGSVFTTLEGKDTVVISTIRLNTLREQFPNLETIYASSFVETENADGELHSALKFTEYPFSWEAIERAYGALIDPPPGGDSPITRPPEDGYPKKTANGNQYQTLNNGRPVYTATNPVDINQDNVIKVCLNRNHADCDYAADQYLDPNDITDVNIPFTGQIEVDHKITEIYPTDMPVDDRPNGIDEITNIYLQEGHYGGATKQSFKGLSGVTQHFNDYLNVAVDEVNKKSVISWNIPREEGRFGNAKLFSNIAEANWYITLAVKGVPFFNRRGRESNFQISITSEDAARFGNFYNPVLPKIKLGYSCLAKGTMITMADGKQIAIENIQSGDLVLGALANQPGSAESMEVVDVSVGVEAIEMYRVTTGDDSILMTETHPVSTTNKGIVWAKELEPGDRILTEEGSVVITQIETESYKDKIYNLKLAPQEKSRLSTMGKADFGMFANGMLVGDLSTQDSFNYKDQNIKLSKEQILERLPEKWKTDYLNSL